MKSHPSHGSGQRRGRRGSRPASRTAAARYESRPAAEPAPKSLWQRLVSFFSGQEQRPAGSRSAAAPAAKPTPQRIERKPERLEVTSPKLYIGNLSYEATESDLSELLNGVGVVRNAEIASNKYNEKSKGFGFVTMATIDEARRAVAELHDKEFMGRKLVVSGAKSDDRETNYRR